MTTQGTTNQTDPFKFAIVEIAKEAKEIGAIGFQNLGPDKINMGHMIEAELEELIKKLNEARKQPQTNTKEHLKKLISEFQIPEGNDEQKKQIQDALNDIVTKIDDPALLIPSTQTAESADDDIEILAAYQIDPGKKAARDFAKALVKMGIDQKSIRFTLDENENWGVRVDFNQGKNADHIPSMLKQAIGSEANYTTSRFLDIN
ncbi:MAG: hypothetical protein AB7V32_11225, partial [Candidatus Berkiella sp.]